MTRTGEPCGWHRPYDRPGNTRRDAKRKGSQIYDASTTSSCSCGWSTTSPSQLGARAMAEHHRREATGSTAKAHQPRRP